MTATEKLMEQLIAFPTVSRDSNLEMIHFIEAYLSGLGISVTLIHNDEQ